MPSRRLRLTNAVARRIARPMLRRTADPAQARRDFDRFASFLPMPRGVRLEATQGGLRLTPAALTTHRRVLYFHGGAYLCGSPSTHRTLCAHIARLSGAIVEVPRYRRAPEHPAPAAFDDAMAAYRTLAAEIGADNIILGGDSAGGGLALAVLAQATAEGRAPAGVFAMSPWTDLSGSGPSRHANRSCDCLLPAERFDEIVAYATGTLPRSDPRVSPLFATFDHPPPVLLHVARTEILHDDALRMAEALRAAGGMVTVSEVPDAPHVWHFLAALIPEARDSLREIAAFVHEL